MNKKETERIKLLVTSFTQKFSSLIQKRALKRGLEFIGSVLCILSIIFLASRFLDVWGQIQFSSYSISVWVMTALTSFFGFAANSFLPFGWKLILQFVDEQVDYSWAYRTYGITQLAKYLPGNIFHFAGRQAIGMDAGCSAWALAKSMLIENVFYVIGGSLFLCLLAPLSYPNLAYGIGFGLFMGSTGAILALVAARFGRALFIAFGIYILNIFLSALPFVIILYLVEGVNGFWQLNMVGIVGAFAVSWLIGLIVPGASAGIGVREVVLIYFLGAYVVEANLLIAVLATRLVNVVGDVLFFVVASVLPKQMPCREK